MTNLITFQKNLIHTDIHLAIIQNPTNIGYLTNFYSNPHERVMLLFVFCDKAPILVLPALDYDMAKATVTQMTLMTYTDNENPFEKLNQIISKYRSGNIGIEKNYVTLHLYDNLNLPSSEQLTDISPLLTTQKLIKNAQEIEKLKIAGTQADLAITYAKENFAIGKSELEIIADMEYKLKQHGISKMSFDTMVLTQKNAANPHGVPSTALLKNNELILVDLGTIYDGYCSDITRTIFFGDKPTQRQKDIYNIVLEAHHTARDQAEIGMSAHELDSIARNIITKYGYGDYFVHRLGHGIGQSIHEFPSIAQNQTITLQENMCFSIEPGIYIPNEIGVRIEDCFVMTKNGLNSLTASPYEQFN